MHIIIILIQYESFRSCLDFIENLTKDAAKNKSSKLILHK